MAGFGALERMVVRASRHGNPRIYDPDLFPWARRLEQEFELVRGELEQLLPEQDSIPCFQDISPEQGHITRDRRWKTYFFYFYGQKVAAHCERCPQTARLLRTIPGMKTAFFSILLPDKIIPVHRGPFNGVLRYHLGLIVPKPETSCGIVVGEEKAHWQEGRSLIFDDTYQHRAWNLGTGLRAILFVDFVRPLLFPASLFSRLYINLVALSPFIRVAMTRQRNWDRALDTLYEKHG
jgi:beta-hydroxylase